MITIKELRMNFAKLSSKEKKVVSEVLDELNIDISEGDERLTGTKPYGFYFEKKYYTIDHHREILLKIAEIAAFKNPTQLNKFFEISGRTRKYFSKNHSELSPDHRKINGTDIYAELNDNAKTLNKRCEKIIIKFGFDLKSFKIN